MKIIEKMTPYTSVSSNIVFLFTFIPPERSYSIQRQEHFPVTLTLPCYQRFCKNTSYTLRKLKSNVRLPLVSYSHQFLLPGFSLPVLPPVSIPMPCTVGILVPSETDLPACSLPASSSVHHTVATARAILQFPNTSVVLH